MAHPDHGAARLVGRERELRALDEFVADAATGGAALLLSGDPGVGKSALLDAAARSAAAQGLRVISGGGVEYETDVSFAGLHQLLDPLTDELEALPAASREALRVALGLGAGPPPDRLAVLGASLALLRRAAADAPLLVVVDDMHWLDRATASVVGSVGRRLAGSRVGLLGATRPCPGGFFERTGWAEVDVAPLDETGASRLLADRFAHLSTRVRREVAHEAQGNPLALLEFAAAAEHLGPGGRYAVSSGPSREVRSLFTARLGRLPDATRRLLLLAVLDGSGDLAVLAEAGGTDGTDGTAHLAPAERDQLVLVDEGAGAVRFRHPLVASAVVELSTHDDRRAAHRRLAEVFAGQPERRGHHLAEAALAPDEAVAAAVEHGAHRTLQRGDVVGAVERLLRAADLSPGRADRSRRIAEAAFLGSFAAGQSRAAELLDEAHREDPTLARTLHAAVATAYLLLNSDGDAAVAHRLLTGAVESALVQPDHDREALSRGLYTLVVVCHFAGRADYWRALDDLLERLGAAAPVEALLLAETHAAPLTAATWALEELDRAVERLPTTRDVELITRTAIAGFYVDRLAGCREALDRVVRDGREGGAVAAALMALNITTFDDLGAGRWEAAERAALEAWELCEALGYRLYGLCGAYSRALLAARRGDLATCSAICEVMVAWAAPRQLRRLDGFAHHALGEAALGAGDVEEAWAHAVAITAPGALDPHDPQAIWSALDLVDAALRTGRTAEARTHAVALRAAGLRRLSPRWALVEVGALAMTATDDEAPLLFREALALPGVDAWPFELARVRLAHGERLRRLRRARDARVELEAARDLFDRLGAVPWSRRAATELRATSSARHVGPAGGAATLTPQEREVVELAASGLSNREIAGRLLVSPRTVSAHLYRAFPKLGVTSRAALRDALGDTGGDAAR